MIVNLQRKISVDLPALKSFATVIAERVTEVAGREFSIAFVSDRRMKELNGFFRGKDATTDVLSFPHEPDQFEMKSPEIGNQNFLGDIVISIEQAERQANENKLTLENEIQQLILHGLLHLCGYDHETDAGEMNRRELQLRRQFKI